MSDFDDLDSLLDPLREPATPAELASERVMIDLMMTSHRNPKGTPMFSSRRARVATLIAAGVIGFGGVAAAGGGLTNSDDAPDVDPAPQQIEVDEEIEVEVEEVEVEEVEAITTTTAAVEIEESDDDMFADEIAKATLAAVAQETDDDGQVDNPETDFDETDCLDGNHGKTVSAVARDELEIDGIEVRDAAHSDCGKTDDDDASEVDDDDDVDVDVDVEVDDDIEDESDEDDSDDDDSDDDDSDDDDSDEKAGRGSKGGNGNGNGNGKSDNDD